VKENRKEGSTIRPQIKVEVNQRKGTSLKKAQAKKDY